jgi:hypothetical protein
MINKITRQLVEAEKLVERRKIDLAKAESEAHALKQQLQVMLSSELAN